MDVPDRVKISGNGTLVEVDSEGKVIRSRYRSGSWAHFRYGKDGRISEFRYARLNWSSTNGTIWTCQGENADYRFEGTIDVGEDGALTLKTEAFTRTIRLTGKRTDSYRDGGKIESYAVGRLATPRDLLAVEKEKKAYWQKESLKTSGQVSDEMNQVLKHLWSTRTATKSTGVWNTISGTPAYLRDMLSNVVPEKPKELQIGEIASRVKDAVGRITGSFKKPEQLSLQSAGISEAKKEKQPEPVAREPEKKDKRSVPYFEGRLATAGPPIISGIGPRLLGPGVVIN